MLRRKSAYDTPCSTPYGTVYPISHPLNHPHHVFIFRTMGRLNEKTVRIDAAFALNTCLWDTALALSNFHLLSISLF
jgi:hypothetical protein